MTPSTLVLFEPVGLLGWGLLAATALLLRRHAPGRWVALAVTAAFFWLATPLGANVMLHPLEARAAQAAECGDPPESPWIVALAGGMSDEGTVATGDWDRLQGPSLKRTLAAVRLARERPGSTLVVSGGIGTAVREADLMASIATAMGVESTRIVVDRDSRSTYESAVAVAGVLRRARPDQVLLVTSALHMARALAAFEAQGVRACARPVDFRWISPPAHHALIPQISALGKSHDVLHELAGLAYYRWSGKLDPASSSTR